MKLTPISTLILSLVFVFNSSAVMAERQQIKAIYIPLADHYAGIVAYEKYRSKMKYADYSIEKMSSWPLLRSYFLSGEVDMAFSVSPMAMDMFSKKPNFRWVSLLNRDGNAMAINDFINKRVNLPVLRKDRIPDAKVADALGKLKQEFGRPTEVGVPDLQSTHTVVLYKYLKDHGRTLALGRGKSEDVVAIVVPPPQSPVYLKKKNNRGLPASFEQSLPWTDVVETKKFGYVSWYSKDVLSWPKGHIDSIAIAQDTTISTKKVALQEVLYYIHKAGEDIEQARRTGGRAMTEISEMIRQHIPQHSHEAIAQSLRPDLNVINYRNLNVDKGGLKQVMDLAVEAKIIKSAVDINAFANENFSVQLDNQTINDEFVLYGLSHQVTPRTNKRIRRAAVALQQLVAKPEIIEAVKQQNDKESTLSSIKQIDQAWINGQQQAFSLSLQNTPIGKMLTNEVQSTIDYVEAFLCDDKGAVVAEYPKTSDYWQGDEEKFTAAFNNGRGRVFVGQLEFDESSSSYTVQVSVPVNDGDNTIGVLIVGIKNLE